MFKQREQTLGQYIVESNRLADVSIKLVDDSKKLSAETLLILEKQGETLKKIEEKNEEIAQAIIKAEEKLNEMKAPWFLSIVQFFKKLIETLKQTLQQQKNLVETIKNTATNEIELTTFAPVKSEPSAVTTKISDLIHKENFSPQEIATMDATDKKLLLINKNLELLRKETIQMSVELDKQNEKLHDIITNTNQNERGLNYVASKTKKL